jgi:hypothetical protein
LIGKIGCKKAYGDTKRMTCIEQQAATQDELRAYWRQVAYDGSVYAPDGCFGTVVASYFESGQSQPVAIVEVVVE